MGKLRPFSAKAASFAFRPPEFDRRINILTGAIRSSKTWSMLPKLTLFLCGNYEVGGERVITGVSKESIYHNVLNDLFDLVGTDNYRYNRMTGELILLGSKWSVVGARDEGSEKYIRGRTIGLAYCDELTLMPRSFFMMLMGRLSPEGARLYGTTNPDTPYHWAKTEILDNPEMAGDVFTEHYTLDDNPNISEEYKQFIRRSYTGVFYDRFVLGLWVVAQGAIYRDVLTSQIWYHDWHPPDLTATCTHCRGGVEMALQGLRSAAGGYVERYIGCDYGTTNPTVFCEVFDDGRMLWADREYYWDSKEQRRQKTDGEYADDLEKFIAQTGQGKRDAQIILDPSAASFRAELLTRGLYVVDADNEVEDGIRMTAAMLNRRRIRINVACVNGRREMETYAWDEKKTEKGKEQPIKQHDHWPDAMRYVVKTKINEWRLAA